MQCTPAFIWLHMPRSSRLALVSQSSSRGFCGCRARFGHQWLGPIWYLEAPREGAGVEDVNTGSLEHSYSWCHIYR